MISGYGTSTGFSMHLQDKSDGSLTDFYNIYLRFIGALNQRPEIAMAYSTFNINFPQYVVSIDAAKGQTRRRIAQRDSLDAFGLLRRPVRFERQPLLEDVLCDDSVRPEIPSQHRVAQ